MPTESTEYLAAYASARSCLIALARRSPPSTAATFDELLFVLDELHEGGDRTSYPLVSTRTDLLEWLEAAVRRMVAEGGDVGALELIVAVSQAV
jgi:hypothetical protein